MKPKNWESYSVELAKAKINFYEPYERLILRKIVEDILVNTGTLRYDLFSIFDAVNKRGQFFSNLSGFNKVQELKRWIEIEYSLPYYKCNFRQIYINNILKKESQVKKYLKLFNKQYKTVEEAFVELHYTATTSSGGYYHFEDDENSFCKQNFAHVDLYMNMKTICFARSSSKKILYEYADKYLLTRKWMILKGYSKPYSDQQLDNLQIMKIYNNNASIALIGWNVANVILALKLQQLKFNVVLYTNFDKQHDLKSLQRILSVQEGVFYLDDGVGGPFSYSELLKQVIYSNIFKNKIQLGQVSNYCGLIDENGRTVPQFRVRQSQQLFLALLADFKFQQSNRKSMKSQIFNLLSRKKLNDELNLINWHLERYLMLNHLNGQDTTINMHYNYLNRRKHKIFMPKKKPVYIKNCEKFVEKAIKSVQIIHAKPKVIDFCNNMWFIQQKLNQRRSFYSLVFSDSQQIFQMVSKKNYKVPSMEHQNFIVLQDLSSCRWIHCSFKFQQKLKFNQDVLSQLYRRKRDFHKICQYDISEQKCSFQLNGKFGFYYYFIVQNGTSLIASCKVQKLLSNSSTSSQLKKSISTDILKQFQMNLLHFQLPELQQPVAIEYSYFFYLKEENLSRERIIKLKTWERMYLSMGFPWALNSNKLTSQIDTSNFILALITNVYYHLYKLDEKAKQNFSKEYKLKKNQISKKQQNIALETPQNQINEQNQQNYVSTKIDQIEIEKPIDIELKKNSQLNKSQEIIIQTNRIEPETKIPKIQVNIQCKIYPLESQMEFIEKLNEKQNTSKDPFGLGSIYIKNILKNLKKRIFNAHLQIEEGLKKLDNNNIDIQSDSYINPVEHKIYKILKEFQMTFEILKPYKLYRNTYLHSLGNLSINVTRAKDLIHKLKSIQNQIIMDQSTENDKKNETLTYEIKINLFDKFMSKREYYSLQNPQKTTVYIQAILYIQIKQDEQQPKPFFVMFQQTNLAIFYYHTHYQNLSQAFNNHLEKRRKLIAKNDSLIYRTDNYYQLTKKSTKMLLMLEQIKQKIQQQIKFQDKSEYLSQEQQLDKILSEKLKSQVPEQVSEDPSQNNLYSKVAYPQNNEQKTQFLLNSLNNLVKYQLELHSIKSDISIVDIFFGFLSQRYFIFQMLYNKIQQNYINKKPQKSLNQILDSIKLKDPIFFNQINSISSQNQKLSNQDYPFYIKYDQNSLTVERRFIATKNDYLIIKSQKNQQIQIQNELITMKRSKSKQKKQVINDCYYVEKQQLLKKYIFIKQFNIGKQFQGNEKRNEKVRCYLMIGENDTKIDLDPRQNPLELIISILVDTWDEGQIFDHFKKLIKKQIWKCQYMLTQRMRLYYQATRKNINLLHLQQVNQLQRSLKYKKSNNLVNNKILYNTKDTEYCKDQDDKQTIYQHLQTNNMVFSDGQIIICKY